MGTESLRWILALTILLQFFEKKYWIYIDWVLLKLELNDSVKQNTVQYFAEDSIHVSSGFFFINIYRFMVRNIYIFVILVKYIFIFVLLNKLRQQVLFASNAGPSRKARLPYICIPDAVHGQIDCCEMREQNATMMGAGRSGAGYKGRTCSLVCFVCAGAGLSEPGRNSLQLIINCPVARLPCM